MIFMLAVWLWQAAAAAPPPDTEIYLAPLTTAAGTIAVGAPGNITNNPGYDNQPAFTPDGSAIFFTSIRGGVAQTDIYRYDIASRQTRPVTKTPEGEYSPTFTPDGRHFSVIRVEAGGTQRLWQFALDGTHPEIVLTDIKPVGYHAWIDDHTLALFVLGQPATLQLADTRSGKADILARNIGRSLQRIPGSATISVVVREPAGEGGASALSIRELDPRTRQLTPLVNAVAGAKEADCAWTPDGLLLMANDDVLYGWRRGDATWTRVADLAALGLHGVTRLAVSPKGDRIAIVTQAKAAAIVALLAPLSAQDRPDPDINTRIRQEEQAHSQIMRTLHFLADVYGPRVTGSPNLKAAGEWAIKTMQSWGFENGHLEPWDFGHPGWVNERFTAHIVSPVKDQLTCEVVAWTPGTSGTVRAHAVQIVLPERPTSAELAAALDQVKDKVKGQIVLVGKRIFVPVNITPPAKRRNDDDVRRQYDPDNPNPNAGRGGRGGPQGPPPPMTARQIDQQVDLFLVANGAKLRVNDAGREHGQIVAYDNRTYDLTKALPTVVMRNEDYGRISRILDDGTSVELEFTIVNTTYPEGRTAYNTISEIPGSDKKDEIVMLGGHLDSWQSATGATDNAIGCAMMMEAARILKALGVKPRRTIRVALWSGEEEGLLGSQAYVKQHFGSAEEPTPEFARFDAYLNIDSGTGRIRGASIFGPASAAAIVRKALAPFQDLGVMGAVATTSRNLGGTDSTSFNNAGLPGIGLSQDPIEYNTHTHHTNLDNYERIIEADVTSSAVEIAATLYQLAMRDEMVPRFTKAEMPPPVARPGAH